MERTDFIVVESGCVRSSEDPPEDEGKMGGFR